jgi:hypothetical protein
MMVREQPVKFSLFQWRIDSAGTELSRKTKNFLVTKFDNLGCRTRIKMMAGCLAWFHRRRSPHEKPAWIGIVERDARIDPLQQDRTLELLRARRLPLRPAKAPLFGAKLRDRMSFDS